MDSTTNTQLDDESRAKLDSIVLKMASQNAPKEDVQAVVADFKLKYGKPVEAPKEVSNSPLPFQQLEKPTGKQIFDMLPGSKLLRDVKTSVGGIFQGIKGGVQKLAGNDSGAQESFGKYRDAVNKIDPVKDFGSGANLALTAALPITGGGATVLRRVGANAAVGAGMGAASAVSKGEPLKDVATQAGFGALTGGVASGLGEAATKAAELLPTRIVRQVLPHLKNPETVDYALNNLKFGSVDTMVQGSRKALDSYDSQIQAILRHPDYVDSPVLGTEIIENTLKQFPNSEYTPASIIEKMKTQLPSEGKVFSALSKGETLPLEEANRLRQQIDRITYKTAIDSPEVKAGKDVAAAFGNSLRTKVKGTAPETVPLFDSYAKEINLTKALNKLLDKEVKKGGVNIGLKDLLSLGAGSVLGGIPGAAIGVASKRLIESPAARIGTAKGIKYLAPSIKKLTPVIGKVGALAGKIPLKKSATTGD